MIGRTTATMTTYAYFFLSTYTQTHVMILKMGLGSGLRVGESFFFLT